MHVYLEKVKKKHKKRQFTGIRMNRSYRRNGVHLLRKIADIYVAYQCWEMLSLVFPSEIGKMLPIKV